MNPAAAKKLVLVSIALMGGAAVIKPTGGNPTFRRLWAVGALGLVLSIGADFAPQVAGPLAALIAIGYLAGAESAITNFFHNAAGAKVAASAPATTGRTGP